MVKHEWLELYWKYGIDVVEKDGRVWIFATQPHTVSLIPGDAILFAEKLITAAAPYVNKDKRRRRTR